MKMNLLGLGFAVASVLAINAPLMAQNGPAPVDIQKINSDCITLDGVADEYAWEEAHVYTIAKKWMDTEPTLVSATWKSVWSENGLYLAIEVVDDEGNWFPEFIDGAESEGGKARGKIRHWASDKPEIYFDASNPLKDGNGVSWEAGNQQFADVFHQDASVYPKENQLHPTSKYGRYADTFDGQGAYTREYFIPWDSLNTTVIEGDDTTTWVKGIDPLTFDGGEGAGVFGLDVSILDVDDTTGSYTTHRAIWENRGLVQENFANLDYAGRIALKTDTCACARKVLASKDEANKNEKLVVFPSPTSDILNVSVEVSSGAIFNLFGQHVMSFSSKELDVSTLKAGVYLIKVEDVSGVKSSTLFTKK